MSQDLLKEVKKQNVDKVQQLLQTQRDKIDINFLDAKTKLGFLHLAIQNYDYETLNALLSDKSDKNQIDLDLKNGDNLTPLALASSLNYIEGVELLLKQKNVDVNYVLDNDDGKTVFHVACSAKNNQDVLDKLIKKGANPNVVSRELGTPLRIALEELDNEKAIWMINNPKVDIFQKDDQDNTCLHHAIVAGVGDFINTLFQILSDRIQEKSSLSDKVKQFLNQKNDQGNTILHQAVISNRISIQRLLKSTGVQLGLDVSIKNKQNKTADELQVEKEEKKKQSDEQVTQRKNEIKVEKAQIKEEKRRVDKQEKEQRLKEEEEEKYREEHAAENKKKSDVRTLIIFFLVLIMMFVGTVLFYQSRRNLQNQPYVPPPRTDYDDFL